ncbi:MAG: tRNA (guanosine(46)-N7)-methyltransferase TrmB [Parvibaculum sp.]
MTNEQDQKPPSAEFSRRRLLYGRRKGHTLRAHHDDLMATLLPKICVPEEGPLKDPRKLFSSSPKEVWLEIGFGGGEHLVAQAATNPDIGMIGCEPFVNGVAKLLSEVEGRGLTNIRIHPNDARDVLERLGEASITRAFLLFPDPWQKKRHHKRRFVSAETLDELARVLVDGGEFRVATDIKHYSRWTLREIRDHGVFSWIAEKPSDWRVRADDWPGTRYEAKAVREGRQPVYLKFRRAPRPERAQKPETAKKPESA